MRRLLILLSLFCTCSIAQAQDYDTKKMRYIEQFKYWAMDEQIRTGVPASISLAQGILETGSGTSELCVEANNHFGIKCKKEWTGETYLHDDDKRHECFRKYKSAKDSYVDHSNFLRDRAHYHFLFDLQPTDYQAWCKGLRKAGYATNPKYAIRLIELIEKYNLQQYTYEAIELGKGDIVADAEVVPVEDKEIKVEPKKEVVLAVQPAAKTLKPKRNYGRLISKNGRSGFWARKGDYLLPEAVQYNIRYAKLLSINDLDDAALYDDMFIYLKKKSKKGDRMYHKVQDGESIHAISQNTGVQLKYLLIYNNLYEGEEPAVGEKIYLQGRSTRTPRLRGQQKTVAKTNRVDAIQGIVNKKEKAEEKVIKVEPREVQPEKVIAKKEIPIKKKEKVVKVLEKKDEPREVIKEKKIVKLIKSDPRVIKKDKAEVKVEKASATTTKIVATKGVSAQSPVLNLEKAKQVEALFGDGKQEVEKLHKRALYEKQQKELQAKLLEEKVIPAPATNNTTLEEEKVIKNKEKIKETKNKRSYDNKNVSDDVKNLKKKFDTLIYDDE